MRHDYNHLRTDLNSDENGDYFDHTIDTAKQGGLNRGPSEGGDNDGALVQERVGDVPEDSKEGEQPSLWVLQSLDHLLLLERLVLHTRLILLDPEDGLGALIRSEEPGTCWRVWEQEPVKNCGHHSNQTGDYHEPVGIHRSIMGPQES